MSGTFPLHSTSKPGVLCLDIHPYFTDLVVSGGVDGKCVIFNAKTQKVVDSIEKHKKKVCSIQFFPDEQLIAFASCSHDNTGAFYLVESDKTENSIVEKYRIANHTKPISSISFHPLKDYALFGSLDGYWSYHNVLRVNFYY